MSNPYEVKWSKELKENFYQSFNEAHLDVLKFCIDQGYRYTTHDAKKGRLKCTEYVSGVTPCTIISFVWKEGFGLRLHCDPNVPCVHWCERKIAKKDIEASIKRKTDKILKDNEAQKRPRLDDAPPESSSNSNQVPTAMFAAENDQYSETLSVYEETSNNVSLIGSNIRVADVVDASLPFDASTEGNNLLIMGATLCRSEPSEVIDISNFDWSSVSTSPEPAAPQTPIQRELGYDSTDDTRGFTDKEVDELNDLFVGLEATSNCETVVYQPTPSSRTVPPANPAPAVNATNVSAPAPIFNFNLAPNAIVINNSVINGGFNIHFHTGQGVHSFQAFL